MSANIRTALVCRVLGYISNLDPRCSISATAKMFYHSLDRHKLHYSLIRDGFRRPPPASPLQMTTMPHVAANNAASRRRAPGVMEISCIAGVRPVKTKGLPWSSLAASRPRIESRRPSLAPLRPAKNHKGYRAPRGRAVPRPTGAPVDYQISPACICRKTDGYYLFSLRISRRGFSGEIKPMFRSPAR